MLGGTITQFNIKTLANLTGKHSKNTNSFKQKITTENWSPFREYTDVWINSVLYTTTSVVE